jgi:hypothetical protein
MRDELAPGVMPFYIDQISPGLHRHIFRRRQGIFRHSFGGGEFSFPHSAQVIVTAHVGGLVPL